MLLRYFLFLVLFFVSLSAHKTGLSFLNIEESNDKSIKVVYEKPLQDTKAKDIYIRYPAKCSQTSPTRQSILDGFVVQKYSLWCSNSGLVGSKIWIDGLVSSDKGVFIHYKKNSKVDKALLRATTPFMTIDYKSSKFEIFFEYVQLGIHHIWSGYDHLMFVFSLVLLALNMRSLLWAISAFTLAHSVTLAFGILGIVSVGASYVEAMIALSIVFLAKEVVVDHRETFTRRYLGLTSFTFGLLHGFGFSSVLRTIGLPQNEIPLSLFSFNAGIELGQLSFIAVVSSLLYIVKKVPSIKERSLNLSIAYIIGTISSMWLIERVIAF